jgi:hypothetical protein
MTILGKKPDSPMPFNDNKSQDFIISQNSINAREENEQLTALEYFLQKPYR